MSFHRATLAALAAVITIGMTSLASACCNWGYFAPVVTNQVVVAPGPIWVGPWSGGWNGQNSVCSRGPWVGCGCYGCVFGWPLGSAVAVLYREPRARVFRSRIDGSLRHLLAGHRSRGAAQISVHLGLPFALLLVINLKTTKALGLTIPISRLR